MTWSNSPCLARNLETFLCRLRVRINFERGFELRCGLVHLSGLEQCMSIRDAKIGLPWQTFHDFGHRFCRGAMLFGLAEQVRVIEAQHPIVRPRLNGLRIDSESLLHVLLR